MNIAMFIDTLTKGNEQKSTEPQTPSASSQTAIDKLNVVAKLMGQSHQNSFNQAIRQLFNSGEFSQI